MPRTKARTSSKKKKKKQPKKPDGHFAKIQAFANDNAKKDTFNSQDSLELALGWIDGGKIDAKRLAKTLPNTARDLRDGACNPKDLAEFLAKVSFYNKHLRSSLGDVATTDVHPGAEHFVAVLARTVPHLEADQELFLRFQSTLHEYIDISHIAQVSSPFRARAHSVIHTIKVAFDKTCKEWEDMLTEKLYDGRVGALRRACPMFGAPLEEFEKIIEDGGRWFYILHNELHVAALGVSMGLDQINDACWECDSVLGDVKRCRGCEAALYCSHGCQKSAWKAGHNKNCSLLGTHYGNLRASLAIVDSAHSKGVIDGLHLNHDLDYHIAVGCSRWPYIQNKPRLFEENDVPDPSMNVFYENLGRIARGESRICSDTISLEQYNANLSQGGHSDKESFMMLCVYLCFDCFGSATEVVITDPAAILGSLFGASFDATSWRDFREKMPAARYLQLYQDFSTYAEGTHRKISRWYTKCAAQKELRENFHN